MEFKECESQYKGACPACGQQVTIYYTKASGSGAACWVPILHTNPLGGTCCDSYETLADDPFMYAQKRLAAAQESLKGGN